MSQQYPCPYCQASYSTEVDLEAHLALVHRCPRCGLLLSNENAVGEHLEQVHGLRHFGAVEPELAELVEIPGWEPPKIPIPTDQGELYRWLLPICERIAEASQPELALRSAPRELSDRVEYVRQHFKRVTGTVKLVRYKRLKDPARKAEYLVIALTNLDLSPSYALQKFGPRPRAE
jgi:uncharacterized C2H2 Zn-finger protein